MLPIYSNTIQAGQRGFRLNRTKSHSLTLIFRRFKAWYHVVHLLRFRLNSFFVLNFSPLFFVVICFLCVIWFSLNSFFHLKFSLLFFDIFQAETKLAFLCDSAWNHVVHLVRFSLKHILSIGCDWGWISFFLRNFHSYFSTYFKLKQSVIFCAF